MAKFGRIFTEKLLKPSAVLFLLLIVVPFTLKNSGKKVLVPFFLIHLLRIFQVPFTYFFYVFVII